MDIVIERFHPRHEAAVGRLVSQIQRDEFGLPVTLDQQPDLRDIANFYQRGCGDFWVAIEDGNIVGTISLLDIGDGQAALRKMFVAASHRGPGPGVARRLLETLVEHARAHQLREIYLGTTALFLAAHRFYEKHGFEAIDPASLPPRFPRMDVDTLFYRLTLNPG